jgi:hypothetical protein
MTNEAVAVQSTYQGDVDLREQIATLINTEKRLNQTIVAKEAGISLATLNQWLAAKYGGNNETVDTKLRLWLEADKARRATNDMMPIAPSFVHTPTAARVLATLAYGQMGGDIVAVYGGAGLGKTSAILYYQSSNPNVWVATLNPSTAGVVTCLQEICDALSLDTSGGARAMMKRIFKRVKDTNGELVIDEAQHASVPALDAIRAIHDATGIGIALVGNDGVFARMAGGRNALQLDRLYSRVGKKLPLRTSTEQDVLMLIKAWGITDTNCYKTLIDIARGQGALRSLTKTLRLASMNAAAEGHGVCCQDVRAAAQDLMGVER